jgi:hypothetical protein
LSDEVIFGCNLPDVLGIIYADRKDMCEQIAGRPSRPKSETFAQRTRTVGSSGNTFALAGGSFIFSLSENRVTKRH